MFEDNNYCCHIFFQCHNEHIICTSAKIMGLINMQTSKEVGIRAARESGGEAEETQIALEQSVERITAVELIYPLKHYVWSDGATSMVV